MKNAMKTAFGAMAAGTMALTPAAVFAEDAANSNEVNVTLASTTNVTMLADADRAAYQWAQANPQGVATAIRLGNDTTVAPQVIEGALRSDFANRGVSVVQFFYESGGEGNSTVAYVTRNHVFGPFRLSQSRAEVSTVANQFTYELSRGLN